MYSPYMYNHNYTSPPPTPPLHDQMVILYRDPQGENIFERTGSINRPGTLNGTVNDEDRARIAELDRHCKQLSTRLSKYEVRQLGSSKQWIKYAVLYNVM